jgi:hypothetical protein
MLPSEGDLDEDELFERILGFCSALEGRLDAVESALGSRIARRRPRRQWLAAKPRRCLSRRSKKASTTALGGTDRWP